MRGAAIAAAAGLMAVAAPAASAAVSRDWEASGRGGARASLAESSVTRGGRTVLRLGDIVVDAPIACRDSPTPAAPSDVETIAQTASVDSDGTFAVGRIHDRVGTRLTGTIRSRSITLVYRHATRRANTFDGGTEICDTGTVRLEGAPRRRPALPSGTWTGETAKGEPVQLHVVAGGRALQEPSRPPGNGAPSAAISFGAFEQSCSTSGCAPYSPDICAYGATETIFVSAAGDFGDLAGRDDDQPAFSGSFRTHRRVTGTFTNGGEGCGETTWSAAPG